MSLDFSPAGPGHTLRKKPLGTVRLVSPPAGPPWGFYSSTSGFGWSRVSLTSRQQLCSC